MGDIIHIEELGRRTLYPYERSELWTAGGHYIHTCESCHHPNCPRAGFHFLACTSHTAYKENENENL